MHDVVFQMVEGLRDVRHLLMMDNFFLSLGLFFDLLSMEIYATRIVSSNRMELLLDLKDTKSFKNEPQGHMM